MCMIDNDCGGSSDRYENSVQLATPAPQLCHRCLSFWTVIFIAVLAALIFGRR